jgi:PAS domain S-box-containing protein
MAQHAMRMFSLSRTQRYGIALLGVAVALAMRLLLDPILKEDVPLFLFVIPVIVAAWSGGLGPGLLATVLSLLVGNYLFMAPRGTISLTNYLTFTRAATFAFLGTSFSLLFDKVRKTVRAEFECLESFGILVDSLQEYAIITLDPRGRVSCWNKGAERIAGYKHREVMGHDFSMLYTPEDIRHDKPKKDLEAANTTGRYVEERWQTRKDGSRFWASTVIAPLRDFHGQLRGFAKVTRDMTERKLAEEALHDSKSFIEQIIDVSPTVISIYDVDQHKTIFVNRGLATALGYPPTHETSDADFLESSMHPDDRHVFQDRVERLNGRSSEDAAEFEFRLRHRSGEWRWFHCRNKTFARNASGATREIICSATDITERKNAEERTRFLANLNAAFMPLADPNEIMQVAVRMLGEHLHVDRCVYGEVDVDEAHLTVLSEYIRGDMPRAIGRYPVSVLSANERQILRDGRAYVLDDFEAVPPPGADLPLYRRFLIRALVGVPLNKRGHFIARMAVHQRTPRYWEPEEIELVRTVANRCWESVERARAIRQLEESEERYRAFIGNSSEAIWRFELDEPIPVELPPHEQLEMVYRSAYLAECNDAMARMYGYERSDQVIGKRIADLITRADLEHLEFFRALKTCGYRLTDVETRAVDTHGKTKYFLNNLMAIRNDGAIVRFWGTSRDVTAQEEASEVIRENEQRLRRITEATQDALWDIDVKTNRLWWSEGAKRLFGRSPVELQIGIEDWYSGIHPDDVDRVHAKFDAFLHGADTEWVDEYRFRRADGIYVDIYDQGRKFFDGGVLRWIGGAMVDITKRKQAEEALRESEERFAKAFKASPDALVISRISDGVFIEVNESFAALTGYPRDELIGKSSITLDLFGNTEDRKRAVEIMKEQNRVHDFQFTMKRKSGELRLMTFSAEPVQIRGEQCWLTIGHDITEQKRIEEEREDLLRQEQTAREEAETASRMKDDFLATISHELRTPLTSILGWARLLASGTFSESQTNHALHVIEQSASAQARLVDDILDTSRIITGRLKLEAQSVDIERVFQAAVEVVRPSAVTKKIALIVTIGDSLGTVLGDANRLQQVIWNLLSNAVKFTNEGGRVDARLRRIDDQVEIVVSDTGIGVDTQFLPYIFDRFRQADSTSTRRYGGLGLGLAIVRHVVEMHGGTVSASSPGRGHGATFKVRFPRFNPAPVAQVETAPSTQSRHIETAPEDEQQRLKGIRVLLVEDDADTLEMLRFILDQYGAEVVTAGSARQALEILNHWRPDALISDLAMPEQDGYELIAQLRARDYKNGGSIPAVALSAYTRTEDRQRALSAGFQMHMSKPVDPDELVNVVANLAGLIHS